MKIGARVPALTLLSLPDQLPRELRRGTREAYAVILPPPSGCGAYLELLADSAASFQRWDGVALVAGEGDGSWFRTRLKMPAEMAALVVVDRYGEVYEVVGAEGCNRLPSPAEIEEWFKYLATQCPECGVPDGPGNTLDGPVW
ncbi:MAG: hypothetical protein ACREKN_00485 [Longimicrobiaceae bacterium]